MSYKSGETVYGGALVRSGWVIASDAYVTEPDCKTYQVNGRGGKVYDTDVLSGGTINNIVVAAHASGNYGYLEDIRISGGGTVVVRSAGNTISSGTIYGGTLYVQSSATADNITVLPNGKVVCSDGLLFNVTVTGGATNKLVDLQGTAYAKNMTVVGTAQATNYVYLSHTAVLENATFTSASVYLAGGGTLRNFTMHSNGTPVLRGEQTYCSGATIYGGALHFQNGAKGDNVVVNGGTLQIHDNGPTAISGSGAYVSRVDVITGNVYVSAGGRIDDLRASGGLVNITSTTGSWGKGATLSGAVFTGGSLTLGAGAVAYATDIGENASATVNGTLNAVNAAYNITQAAGTVNIAATAEGGNIVQNGGTLNIAPGADIDGLTYNGGTFTISAGATIKNFYKVGGTANISVLTGATVDGGELHTAYLQALGNNKVGNVTIKNYTVYGGLLIVRGSNNVASSIKVSGGGLCVQSAGGSGVDIDVYDGGALNMNNGGNAFVSSVRIHSGGKINGYAGGHAYRDITVESGGAWDLQNASVSGANVSGATVTIYGQYSYISGGAVFKDMTFAGKAGDAIEDWVYITDPYDATSGGAAYGQMLNSNVTVSSGAMIRLYGTNVYGSDAQVYGKYYVQNGATLSGGTIHSGGFVNMWNQANFNDQGVRAKTVGVTVSSGGSADSTDDDFFNMTVEAGARLGLGGGAGLGGNANTIAAGTLVIDGAIDADAQTDENHVLCNLNVSAQSLHLKDGIALKDLSIGHAGKIYASDTTITGLDIEAPEQTVAGRLYMNGGAISGGRIHGTGTINALYMTDGAKFNDAHVSDGGVFMSANAEMTNLEMTGGIVVLRGEQTYISGATISGGALHIQNGGDGDNITVAGGGLCASDTTFTNPTGKTEVVNNVIMTAGSVRIGAGATINNLQATGGTIYMTSGGTINNTVAEYTLNNVSAVAGARVNYVRNKNAATIQGSNTNIAASTFYYDGATTANGFSVVNGVVKNLGADGKAYRIGVGSGIVVEDAVVNDSWRISAFGNAVVSGVNISGGPTEAASIVMRDDSVVYDAFLTGINAASGGVINLYENAKASGTVVGRNGKLGIVAATTEIEDTTIMAGGNLTFSASGVGANTGDLLTLDFTGTGGNQSVNINNMAAISDTTKIVLSGWTAGNTYTLTTGAATNKAVQCYDWGLYQDTVQGGTTYTNAFDGISYDFTNGKAIVVSTFTAATQETAGSIESGATINGNGRAAKWTNNTTVTSGATIKAATSSIAGDAWLELDGANLTGTTLYGADNTFAGGAVNLYATGNATVGNLAAGAEATGTVGAVKLTVDSATVGLAYAGGFGNVTGATETLIGEGAKMQKDFYAGALANYAKTNTATSAGDVTLDIEAGEFSGNIYGAASVKAGSATTLVHNVGNVTINVAGGETKKGNQACLFAGGYATGSVASDNAVYTVNNIDVTIDGGTWTSGTTAGGRGVFGGIFASKVTAVAEDVTMTINGGTFGNVYGGGWAQKNGTSKVGDVNISIEGGEIANVFGGGSHSTSGGTTVAGNVTITVSGGNITGDIFARGQLDGDTTGAAEVIFTGGTNYSCGVWGYSYVSGGTETEDDVKLSFDGYTGTFAGKVGGFNSIAFADDAAATFDAAADIANGKWEFDLSARAEALSDTSLLTWSDADFAGDTVKVAFADATQAAAGWSIATAAFDATTTFDLYIGSDKIAEGIAYDTAIAEGDWAGWKFTSVDGTLKFANLA